MIHGISLLGRLGWRRGTRGLWEYLAVRAVARAEVEKDRIALEKERERNRAFADIAHLPDVTELADSEDGGRKIWIRKTGCGPLSPDAPHSQAMVVSEAVPVVEIASAESDFAGEIPP